MTSAPTARPRSVPLPRTWGVRPRDVVALLLANGVFIVLMWVRHGGLDELGTLSGILTAIGQLTALEGTYLALLGLVLMGRSPWLDEAFGMDRLAWAHRWLGFATVWLIAAHLAFTVTGYALGDGRNVIEELAQLVWTFPYVMWALVAFLLFVMLGVTSLRAARRRLSYESWFHLHLYAYLAIALAFLHQLFAGADFIHDQLAAIYWISLYVLAGTLVLVFRVGQPLVTSARHRPRVSAVVPEAPGVVSIYLSGRDLDRLPVRSGQYFIVRFLTRDGWWRGHPFSLSSAPNGRWLRITVKALGDDSARLQRVPVGTKAFIEGPYGVLTGARRTRREVTLIAAGIGIAPLRALLESLAARPGELTLIYRARREADVVFRAELDLLAVHRGATVHYLVGSRYDDPPAGALDGAAIARLVPDVAQQDVYLCGPAGLMREVEADLGALGVPATQVHAERFAY
ncbi:MAG: ferredoxin reductase family protein [Candidatus Limnocylindrales bacterium]